MQHRVGGGYILFSSILLGSPGIAAGAGAIFLAFGTVEPEVWLALFTLAMIFELPLHILFAHFWNRRARKLALEITPA